MLGRKGLNISSLSSVCRCVKNPANAVAEAVHVKVPVEAFHINNSFTLIFKHKHSQRRPTASILLLAVRAVGSSFEVKLLNWVFVVRR